MNKVITRYGMYGVAVLFVISLVSFLAFRGNPNYEVQEVIGYASIVASLVFVYFGIRKWRDSYNGGQLTFGKGLALGTLITLFPSVAFGLFSWIEMKYLDPEFLDKYYGYYEDKIRKTTPPAEVQAALKDMADAKEMFSSPLAQFGLMFLTVFIIGFIITIISALILRRNKPPHLN